MRTLPRLLYTLLTLTCLLASAEARSATGDSYPSKSIRIVVPAPAGGPGDTIARLIGRHMSETWKQAIVIENKPGANNITATEMVAKAAPDGYTLLLTVDYALTVNPHTQKQLPYDPLRDFIHISTIANAVCVVVVNSSIPAKSLPDLLKYAATRPEGLTVAVGTLTTRLMTERLAELTKLKLLAVPYKGSAESLTAIMGNHVDMSFAGFTPFKEHVGRGRFTVLASTGNVRSAATPNTPTLLELGYPGFQTGVWMGLAAPAATPAPTIKVISDELAKILAKPEVIEQFNRLGLDPMPSNVAATTEMIREESARWGKLIKEKNIRVD